MTANRKRASKPERIPQKRPRWSTEDLELLRRLHPRTPDVIIAWRLRRPLQGITSKAHKLRLKKDPQRLVRMGKENILHRWGKKRRTRRRA